MIPGILNTVIGLILVYMSVLHLALIEGRVWHLLVAGVAIVILAMWSRAGDAMKWFSTSVVVLGICLFLFGVLQWMTPMAHLFAFWFVFFAGILVAVFSLWAAVYRPGPQQISAG